MISIPKNDILRPFFVCFWNLILNQFNIVNAERLFCQFNNYIMAPGGDKKYYGLLLGNEIKFLYLQPEIKI